MDGFLRKLRYYFRRRQFERELHEEMEHHRSLSGAAQFGNMTRLKEDSRAAWSWAPVEGIVRDLRYALRSFLKTPGFTAAVVLTLALGIGATTAIFSVINGVLIQPLPFPESDRLIDLRLRSLNQAGSDMPASPAIYFTYRDNNETFESVALWVPGTASITGAGDPETVQALNVTYEFLPTLRVEPALGRSFSETDDQPGSARTVILSYSYWQRLFGGAESALGGTLVVDGEPHTVVGVLPRGFRFLPQGPAEIVRPMQLRRGSALLGPLGERGLARLKDGVTLQEASADVERMIPILYDTFPLYIPGVTTENLVWAPNLQFLRDVIVGDLDDVLWVLMGTIGMLLVIACANVANLQLARTQVRGHELAMKAALGAGWRTIARGLLVESTLLGLAGGTAGLLFATLALPVLLSLAAEHLPSVLEVSIDWTVLGFMLAVSLASGLFFGSIPLLRYAAPRIGPALDTSGRSLGSSRERHRARNALVVAQVSLALILLVASGLMIRTFQSLRNVDPGFTEPGTIQTVNIAIPEASAPEFARVTRMFNDIQDRLSEVAGVESAAFTSHLPLEFGPWGPFFLESDPLPEGPSPPSRQFRIASPRLFETFGVPLVAGRAFEWTDHYGGQPHVIVSEGMARAEWGTPAAALGQRIRQAPSDPWSEVVGVVGDVHHQGLDQPAPDTVYLTLGDGRAPFFARGVSFVIRSGRVGTAGFLEDIQEAIWSVNASLPLARVRTLGEIHAQSMARTSLILVLLAVTAGMALTLGLVGIYGVVNYMLAQRRREIGVRMALGAQNAELKRMLLGQTLASVAVGVALGLGGAAGLTGLMGSFLFGVTALDPATYAAVTALLVGVAAVAAYLPARRAARIDPIEALRAE